VVVQAEEQAEDQAEQQQQAQQQAQQAQQAQQQAEPASQDTQTNQRHSDAEVAHANMEHMEQIEVSPEGGGEALPAADAVPATSLKADAAVEASGTAAVPEPPEVGQTTPLPNKDAGGESAAAAAIPAPPLTPPPPPPTPPPLQPRQPPARTAAPPVVVVSTAPIVVPDDEDLIDDVEFTNPNIHTPGGSPSSLDPARPSLIPLITIICGMCAVIWGCIALVWRATRENINLIMNQGAPGHALMPPTPTKSATKNWSGKPLAHCRPNLKKKKPSM
jgi:hypothetical protein